ncbi:MAG: hypothetical protein CFE21_09765 [Bacteroidetes bacterium B1(2017)]|nr:MAG: hypothetical protein CFE21_09765 [Bacteroidetes bacterium B1(2017)]
MPSFTTKYNFNEMPFPVSLQNKSVNPSGNRFEERMEVDYFSISIPFIRYKQEQNGFYSKMEVILGYDYYSSQMDYKQYSNGQTLYYNDKEKIHGYRYVADAGIVKPYYFLPEGKLILMPCLSVFADMYLYDKTTSYIIDTDIDNTYGSVFIFGARISFAANYLIGKRFGLGLNWKNIVSWQHELITDSRFEGEATENHVIVTLNQMPRLNVLYYFNRMEKKKKF